MPQVTLRFEGLFTFVVRRTSTSAAKPNGVYALLPRTQGAFPHPHYGSIEWGTNTAALNGNVDVRGGGSGLVAGAGPRIGRLLPLSRVNGRIDERLLTGPYASASNELAGRVLLPLHRMSRSDHHVRIEWERTPGTWVDVGTVTGVTELTYNTTGPVHIPGVPGPITEALVIFKNLPHHNQVGDHSKGDPLEHADGHGILFGNKTPKFRIAEDYHGLKMQTTAAAGFGVDPVICAQGGGCDPDDAACNGCDPTMPGCGEG